MYTFAVSIRFTPASKHWSICRRASSSPTEPTGPDGFRPSVIVPMPIAETFRPERPSRRYSIVSPLFG